MRLFFAKLRFIVCCFGLVHIFASSGEHASGPPVQTILFNPQPQGNSGEPVGNPAVLLLQPDDNSSAYGALFKVIFDYSNRRSRRESEEVSIAQDAYSRFCCVIDSVLLCGCCVTGLAVFCATCGCFCCCCCHGRDLIPEQ